MRSDDGRSDCIKVLDDCSWDLETLVKEYQEARATNEQLYDDINDLNDTVSDQADEISELADEVENYKEEVERLEKELASKS